MSTKRELLAALNDPRCPMDAEITIRAVQRGRNDGPYGSFYADTYPIRDTFTGWEDGTWSLLAYAPIADLGLQEIEEIDASRSVLWHADGEPWSGADWSNAMCGECGEAANVVKKIRRIETNATGKVAEKDLDFLKDKLAEELADTLLYMLLLAHHYGLNLAAGVIKKFNSTSREFGFPQVLREWR